MARGSIPVPPDLPVPRIWILRRPVWRERRSGVMQRLKAHACAMVRSGDQGDGALHQRRVAREAAEERVAVAQLGDRRSEEHTSELQSLMRNSYAVVCLKKKKHRTRDIQARVQKYDQLDDAKY